jgi:hypothetical protein
MAQTLQGIIEEHDLVYRQLKEIAELENDRHYAHAHTSDKKKAEESFRSRREARKNNESVVGDDVFPDEDFYQKGIAPRISKLTKDPAEFKRLSQTSLRSLSKMHDGFVTGAATKKGVIQIFFQQFFDFLHEQDEKVILGIAGLQSRRANLHNDGGDYPVRDYSIQDFINTFQKSEFSGYLPDAGEVLGNIENGFVGETYKDCVLKILKKFKEEGIEDLIPAYFRLSKAARFPQQYGFDFKSFEITKTFKSLQETGEYLDQVLEYCTEDLGQNDRSIRNDEENTLVKQVKRLKDSCFADRLPELLDTALDLKKRGVNAFHYLENIDTKNPSFLRNEGAILRYTRDLAAISDSCVTCLQEKWKGIMKQG